jgi:hypothetical protein
VSVVQFVGGIQLLDVTAPNPIRDALIFFDPGIAPHDALVLAAQFNGGPDVPPLIGFGDFIDLNLGVIFINEAAAVLGPNGFLPFGILSQFHPGGLTLVDAAAGDQFTADVFVQGIAIDGSDHVANSVPTAAFNLSNIVPGPGYLPGASAIVDEFVNVGSGSFLLTFVAPSPTTISQLFTRTGAEPNNIEASYAGAIGTFVPESSTVLAGGAAMLLGLGVWFRRRFQK